MAGGLCQYVVPILIYSLRTDMIDNLVTLTEVMLGFGIGRKKLRAWNLIGPANANTQKGIVL
jgi:hypothetical protein